jgi:ABC-type transport system involved in cytochrome c biogenesis permease subunit
VNNLDIFTSETPIIELIESILYIVGTIFAAILIALSISAYRNTQLQKLLYAIVAFLLFGIFLFYEFLEHSIPLDNAFTDIVIPAMGVSILVLFFLAIVNKK